MLHCMATGDPVPTIKWDKNGEMNGLDAKRFQVFENGSLLLRYVKESDKGIYGCTAGNSGGLKREEARLVIKGSVRKKNTLRTDLNIKSSHFLFFVLPRYR